MPGSESSESPERLKVLFEDGRLVVIDKPPGRLTIPGRTPEPLPCLQEQLQQERGGERLWVVHRLDRGTSGCLAFARNAEAHRTLSMAFEAQQVHKRYLALVRGQLQPDVGSFTQALSPGRKGGMRLARPGEAGKPAETRFRVLERFQGPLGSPGYCWVECEPLTGRLHQIRVHLGFAGHPLAVDEDYRGAASLSTRDLGGSTEEVVLARTPLHCSSMALPGGVSVSAPVPEDLGRVLLLLRTPPDAGREPGAPAGTPALS